MLPSLNRPEIGVLAYFVAMFLVGFLVGRVDQIGQSTLGEIVPWPDTYAAVLLVVCVVLGEYLLSRK